MEEHSNLIILEGRDNLDKHYDTQVKKMKLVRIIILKKKAFSSFIYLLCIHSSFEISVKTINTNQHIFSLSYSFLLMAVLLL